MCDKNDEPSVPTTPESSLSTDLPFLTRSSDYVSEGDTSETANAKCLVVEPRTKAQLSSCQSSVKSDELSSKRLKPSRRLSPIKLLNDVPSKKYCRKKKQLTELCNRKAEEVTDTTSESSASTRKGKLPRRKLKERAGDNDIKVPRSRSRATKGDKNCDNGKPKMTGKAKNEGKSKRGRKPKRSFQTEPALSSRQELEALEEEGLNLELICFNITEEDMKIDKVVPIFPEKYRNLPGGTLLDCPNQKVIESSAGPPAVLTKAALKETPIPPATCSSVQTMLKVLIYFMKAIRSCPKLN